MCGGLLGSFPYHLLLHRKISPRFLPTKARPTVRLGWTPSSKTTGLKATLLDDWQQLKPSFGTPLYSEVELETIFYFSLTTLLLLKYFFFSSKICLHFFFLLKRRKSLHRRVKLLTITVTLPHYVNVFTRQCTKPLRF